MCKGLGCSSASPAALGTFNRSHAVGLCYACLLCATQMLLFPMHLPSQGFVLGQYGLLYALANEELIDRLFILNTPLALNSKLRPELAAYKSPIPFLRPGNVSGDL